VRELTGETLVELLDRASGRAPDRVALVMRRGLRQERWSYRELAEASRRVATTLAGVSVKPADRILTWSANDPWLVAAYFAAWRLGAVIVPLDLRMAEEVAVRIGRAARPTLALIGPDVSEAAADALGVRRLRLAPEELEPKGPGDAVSVSGPVAVIGPAGPAPDSLAEILFTSGTTTDPKGVMLTHGQLIHSTRTITLTAGRDAERGLSLIPLSHMYGQIVPLLHGLVTGSTLTFLSTLAPSALFEALRRDRISVITAVPAVLRLLLDGIESEAQRQGRLDRLRRLRRIALRLPLRVRRLLFRPVLSRLGGSLEVVTCGGALLPPELQLGWEAMGVRVVQGYGATECATITGHSRTSRRTGSVGLPLAGIEIRLGDDGEILVRGPSVMSGYWERPRETAQALAGGWLHTGDAGGFADGELVILGRTGDRIALPSGLNVYPEDVEAALLAADGRGAPVASRVIKSALVTEGGPGELVAIIVPLAGTSDVEIDAAVRAASATLAPHQRLRRWVRWPDDDFPRTHTLKVRRAAVLGWLREYDATTPGLPSPADRPSGALTSPRPAPTPEAPITGRLIEVIDRVLAETGGQAGRAIRRDTPLTALELDSLGLVALAMAIDETFGASLDEQQIAGAVDVTALAELVAASRGLRSTDARGRWAFSKPARLARQVLDAVLTRPLVGLVARPQAVGLDNLRKADGPVLICPNHTSHLDAPVVRHALPVDVRRRTAIAAAADYFFEGGPLGPAVALATGAFPFGRTENVRASLERVAEFVDEGWNVMIFPEGTRSATGELGVVRQGIGLLATNLQVPIVPVHIRGTHAILPKGRLAPRRGDPVVVRFGEPLLVPATLTAPEATARVEAALRQLASS
jgi:long-chain acyl-CoA synthetase